MSLTAMTIVARILLALVGFGWWALACSIAF
jgi:hypothetical protein